MIQWNQTYRRNGCQDLTSSKRKIRFEWDRKIMFSQRENRRFIWSKRSNCLYDLSPLYLNLTEFLEERNNSSSDPHRRGLSEDFWLILLLRFPLAQNWKGTEVQVIGNNVSEMKCMEILARKWKDREDYQVRTLPRLTSHSPCLEIYTFSGTFSALNSEFHCKKQCSLGLVGRAKNKISVSFSTVI